MQTRGGEIGFIRRAKDNTLMMQLPDQTFYTNTNIPFGKFQDTVNDPQKAQEFAQMVTQSNVVGGNEADIQQAQNFEQLKMEMNSSFTQTNYRTLGLSNQMSNTRMLIEDMADELSDELYTNIEDIGEQVSSLTKEL